MLPLDKSRACGRWHERAGEFSMSKFRSKGFLAVLILRSASRGSLDSISVVQNWNVTFT